MNERFSSQWREMALVIRTALRSSVAKNAASLYVIQFANYILPLITIPYLVRVLGPAGFGVVAFGQSLIGYFIIFVDYGFAFSATRKISVERNNPVKVSQIAFNVWAAKGFLCIAGFVTLLLLISFVPKLRESAILLLILYGMVIGNVLFPTWLFQGMERMVMISVINLVIRAFVVVGIFLLIRQPEHYLLYAGLLSFSSVAAGIWGAATAWRMFGLHFNIPSFRGMMQALKEGGVLFLSQASISLYTVGNAFILGMLTNPTIVGYYSAAEKIISAIKGLWGPITQAAYPRFSKMAVESKTLALQWARRMLVIMGGLGLILSITLFVGAPLIVRLVLGPEYEPSIMVVRILAPLPLLISISNVLGVQIMYPFRLEKAVLAIVFTAGLLNITIAILLASTWLASGMALAVLISEAFVTIGFLFYLQMNNLSPVGKLQVRENDEKPD